jgi:cell division protein DivIC
MSDKDVPQPKSPYLRPARPAPNVAGRATLVVLGLGLVTVLVLSALGDNGLGEYLRLKAERDQLRAELEELQAETATLEARTDALQTDPMALERLARERYNMRRPGEEVILVRPEDDSGSRP